MIHDHYGPAYDSDDCEEPWPWGAYYRVSDPKQEELGFGFNAQKRQLPLDVARLGGRLVKEYLEPGISGDSLKYRPKMREVLADARAGLIRVAIAIEDNRFSRGEFSDWGEIAKTCDDTGLCLADPKGIFFNPDNDDQRMMLWFRGGMSEGEKRRIRRRMMRGKLEALAQGFLPQGGAPFGYRTIRLGPKPCQKRLEIVEAEARVVRDIFRFAVYGGDALGGPMGAVRIADYLNNVLRIPAPTHPYWERCSEKQSAATSGRWTATTIAQMLRNDVYRGQWAYSRRQYGPPEVPRVAVPKKPGRSSGKIRDRAKWRFTEAGARSSLDGEEVVPPIDDEGLWEAAQVARSKRDRKTQGRPTEKEKGLLIGLLRCPHCETGFSQYRDHWTKKDGSAHEVRHYACNGRYRAKHRGEPACRNPRWPAEVVEAAACADVERLLASPELLEEMVRAGQAEAGLTGAAHLPAPGDIKKQLADLDARRKKNREWAHAGIISEEELKADLIESQKLRAELEESLARAAAVAAEHRQHERAVETAFDVCREYRELWRDCDSDQRRAVLMDLIERAELDAEGWLTLHYHIGGEQRLSIMKEKTFSLKPFAFKGKPLAFSVRLPLRPAERRAA